jgi:hypothetical protein
LAAAIESIVVWVPKSLEITMQIASATVTAISATPRCRSRWVRGPRWRSVIFGRRMDMVSC